MMKIPPTVHYAQSGDVSIAYQVIGDGPRDLLLVPGWVFNIEVAWEYPPLARWLRRLASFSRLVLFDKRGTGLSDRMTNMPTLEERMDDVRAVLDAVGSDSTAIFGYSEGGAMSALFAATYPQRTQALVMLAGFARRCAAPGHPWGPTLEQLQQRVAEYRRHWGTPLGVEIGAPSLANDERGREWWARFLRSSASPSAAAMLTLLNAEIDIRPLMPGIHAPTLLLHSRRDQMVPVECSRYMAREIPNARYVELDGLDHIPWGDDADRIADEIEEFLTGTRRSAEPDRILATVLFIDIVGSTEKAVSLGDRRWSDLLGDFQAVVRNALARSRGTEIDTAGDGFLASFDGPARGVRCAKEIVRSVLKLGLEVRAGLHTGECEVLGDKLSGVAVHTGARVAALAAPGEVLVSATLKDLVAGSGLSFDDRGIHTLKGLPGEWRLFAVAD